YPLQALPGPPRPDEALVRRVVVPEANPWDPESPFLYDGVVELWQDGSRVDRRVIRTGLLSVSLGSTGLRVNGRPFTLRGGELPGRASSAATELVLQRQAGRNLLLTPVTPLTAGLWSVAEEYGVFVVGLLDEAEPRSLALAHSLSRHVSCFGCLARVPLADPPPGRLGLLADALPPRPPPGVSFLVVPAARAGEAAGTGLPLLVRGPAEVAPPVFGVIEE